MTDPERKKILNALLFYADEKNYERGYQGYGEANDTRSEVQKDNGRLARLALELD